MPAEDSEPDRAILLAVGGLLHREIAIDELLMRMVDGIRETLGADRGTIYLLDRGSDELVSTAAHLPELEEIRLRLGQGVAGHVARTGAAINVPTTSDETRFFRGVDKQTGYETRSILAVPMRDHAGRILGVVQLLNKQGGAFPAGDVPLLERLADQAALAIEATTLYAELARAPAEPPRRLPLSGQFNRIVGESEELRAACRRTARAAATTATVLIRGESGTGKELFARAIHVNSPRSEGPLVKVDCAALPETLIENELFGHERGAFTGADDRALGKFDVARGGTIFLDEIGELPLGVQGKLLGVLQDRAFLRVGGTAPITTDVRVVSATNRDLKAMVDAGRFRRDLYYRIKVVEITLPSLRTRGPEDIARLATHFVHAAAKRHGRTVRRVTPEAIARLAAYAWPGNVRELENCIESAVVVMEGDELGPDDLPLPAPSHDPARALREPPPRVGLDGSGRVPTLAEVERAHILGVLAHTGNNQTLAAKLLGIGRNTLGRRLRDYDIDPDG